MSRPALTPKAAFELATALLDADAPRDSRLEEIIQQDSYWAHIYGRYCLSSVEDMVQFQASVRKKVRTV